jgi:hypothetical protein
MDDPAEHALVIKAFQDGLSNCVEWDQKESRRVFAQCDRTPQFIRQETIRYVKRCGGSVVKQRLETREEWRDRYHFYYQVILPLDGFKHGLFVEMRLTSGNEPGDDPDFPEVTLVNAHPQLKS